MTFRLCATHALLFFVFTVFAQGESPTQSVAAPTKSWYKIGFVDVYSLRDGYFSLGGHRQDTTYVPINCIGVVIGKKFDVASWFSTTVLGDISYGRGVLDTSSMSLTNGETHLIERGDDLVLVSLALEGDCLAPFSLPVKPFLASRVAVSFASLNQTGKIIDKDTSLTIANDFWAQSSKIVASIAMGFGITLPLVNRTSITLRYLYSIWDPVAYVYQDGMITDGVPYVEFFHSHSIQLTFDWMHR